MYKALVKSVQSIQRSSAFANDLWMNYVGENGIVEPNRTTPTHNPTKYAISFLGDFLQYAAARCEDTEALNEFFTVVMLKDNEL